MSGRTRRWQDCNICWGYAHDLFWINSLNPLWYDNYLRLSHGARFWIHTFSCRGHCSWSNRYNPDEVLWRVYTSMAICRNHCVLLHCFLSSRSDAVDDSNGYCVRNLVRCWNRINQPFGLVGKWAKAGFPGDRRHVPDLRWGSGYQYFSKSSPH